MINREAAFFPSDDIRECQMFYDWNLVECLRWAAPPFDIFSKM
ncbi:MAG: hypothetical protein ACTSVZ_09335 [Promethearchaeota archaeon]